MYRFWSPAEIERLRADYPDTSNPVLAERLGRSEAAVSMMAVKLGLKKSEEAPRGRFTKGHDTWNRGVPGSTGNHPNTRRTQFTKGQRSGAANQNYRPIGSELLNKDGIVLRKVSETGVRKKDWRPVHVLVWEQANGPVPAGHVVVFRNGMRTALTSAITKESLELVTRAELMRRNSYLTRYPKDVADVIRLRGALNRKINNRSKSA